METEEGLCKKNDLEEPARNGSAGYFGGSEIWKLLGLSVLVAMILIGCSRTWNYVELAEPAIAESPSASDCKECHEDEYASWDKTKHSEPSRMQKIPFQQLHECGACHDNLVPHVDELGDDVPSAIPEMTKTEQNAVCGKCHYNQELLGRKAINPHDKHALFMSVGFQDKKRLISCLECHSGHEGKGNMLQGIRAHNCFKCHKEAIVTMGVFQPLNYLFVGKVCFACHPPHGGTTKGMVARMTTGIALTCVPCHLPGS